LPGGNERILDNVAGILISAGYTESDIKQHALVAPHYMFKGREISVPAGMRQRFIIAGIW
jgi:hypothetical protein